MKNEGIIKNYVADAAIGKYRICKFGSTDGSAAQAASSTDLLIGVTSRVTADQAGDRVDVIRDGIAEVQYGGTVTRGQKLTSDASGRAVAAAPGAGVNAQIIGVAEVSGVVDDIGSLQIAISVMQG